MPTVRGEPEWLKKALDEARQDGRLREGSVPAAPAGPLRKRGKPEYEFQTAVIDYAHARGWKVVIVRPVRIARPDGSVYYQTPFGADGKGFFDTLFARERVVFAELKARGYPSPEQKAWKLLMERAGQEVYLWRPKDWSQIEKVLA